ncbi:MAG: beta-lactamase family protein, partial [Gemmatimonadota bacterium]|nr:beta-lactamase family protein [Gemmatimonadota bacterium]
RTVALALCCAGSAAHAQGLPTAKPEEVGLSAAALGRIAPMMQGYVDSGRIGGAVALVARRGRVAYVQSVGMADIASGRAMTPNALFRIASMTKPVTAVAIMRLIEDGEIRLDDPVSKFIPRFADVRVYAGGGAAHPALEAPRRPITIQDLLTHTAGMTYGFFGNSSVDSIYLASGIVMNPAITIEQFADSLAHLPLLFSPGERWNYSVALDVLGRVVEVASGMPFDRYLDERIFKPLRMTETSFHVAPALRPRMVTVYTRRGDGRLAGGGDVEPIYADGRFLSGGGGLVSTVADYLRFAQMLVAGGTLDGARILKPETVALMRRNCLPGTMRLSRAIAGQSGYGFGLGGAVLVDSGAPAGGAPGLFRWAGAFNTYFWIDPKNELVGMIWTQVWPFRPFPLEAQFQRLVYDAVDKP